MGAIAYLTYWLRQEKKGVLINARDLNGTCHLKAFARF